MLNFNVIAGNKMLRKFFHLTLKPNLQQFSSVRPLSDCKNVNSILIQFFGFFHLLL